VATGCQPVVPQFAFARELVAHVATGCQPVVPQLAFARELVGRAIASGVATGRARVVFDPLQSNLEQGDILVCPSTDPGWTPLFLTAGGLVIERGGVLSHGAIVARDFGIPAVACPHATRALRDGDRIRVDGNTGRVHVLSRENGHV
jgi:phosphoenolpyruvate synthase/pyruvate phosphate dikinase